jgi:superfamily II DNA/RNA helicase
MSFENLGLDPAILGALASSGYTDPTPVQTEAIPLVLAGHDLMVSAQTGSGKTAAFMLPALQKLAVPSPVEGRGPRILVLTPTRELATQITTAAEKYGKNLPRIRMGSILGGMPYPVQNKMLSSRLDILVATPGRLLDHIGRGRIDFSRLEILVIDEADRMLDMGFIADVEEIGKALPATRQTLMFSATFDGPIADLAQHILKEPKRLSIAGAKTKHENIEQRLLYTDDMGHKNRLLDHLLRDVAVNQALVFTSTKAHADDLADRLAIEGFDAAALHGDMSQRDRNRTLLGMRQGRIRVLVATDVAARGIDVQGITHVFNYDLPRQAEDYVHRIGRTGRAGRAGIAISFAGGRDAGQVKQIERYTAQTIPVHTVVGHEPRYASAIQRKPGPRPSGARNGKPAYRGEGRPAPRHDGAYEQRSNGGHGNHGGQPERAQGGYRGNANTDRPTGGFGGRNAAPRGEPRQGWGRNAVSTQPSQHVADPYDRQGDRFRAELRVQAERTASPYAAQPARRSRTQPFNRSAAPAQPRWAEDRRESHRRDDGIGGAERVRHQPQITTLKKKTHG